MWHLKVLIEDACLTSFEWMYHHFAPLNEKHFCLFADRQAAHKQLTSIILFLLQEKLCYQILTYRIHRKLCVLRYQVYQITR